MHTTLSHGQVPGNHGQEIESVIAEMMSGQGYDGVKIYWEEEKDFWSVLKQTFQGRDVFLPPKSGGGVKVIEHRLKCLWNKTFLI